MLACGGTELIGSGSTITEEVVWNDGSERRRDGWRVQHDVSGADVADRRAGFSGTGRGVPDVAGDASPESGYNILVDGEQEVVGGTSAVAPLWAALIALINQMKGSPVGFVNPTAVSGCGGFSRHYAGEQRDVFGGTGMGCVHGAGIAERAGDCCGAGVRGTGIRDGSQAPGEKRAAGLLMELFHTGSEEKSGCFGYAVVRYAFLGNAMVF